MAPATPPRASAAPTIEVVLTDREGRTVPPHGHPPDDDGPPPTNWRRLVAIASILGAVLGISIAVLVLNADGSDDPDVPTQETAPIDDVDLSEITTPVLDPVDRLPAPELGQQNTLSTAPQGNTAQTGERVEPRDGRLALPTVDAPADAGQYDLGTSMSELDLDIARRSTSEIEVDELFEFDTRITYDAANDRYEIAVLSNAVIDRLIIDVAGGWTYSDDSLNTWTRIDNETLAEVIGVSDMRTYVEQLMLGPVRPDTFSHAVSIEPERFVDLGGGVIALEYTVTLPAAAIPEWDVYVLVPTSDTDPASPNDELTFYAYVTSEAKLRSVVGRPTSGSGSRLVAHDLVRLTTPVTIPLPPAEQVENFVNVVPPDDG